MNDFSDQELEEYLNDAYISIHLEEDFVKYQEEYILLSFYQEFLNKEGSKNNDLFNEKGEC